MAAVNIERYLHFEAEQSVEAIKRWLAVHAISDNLRRDLSDEVARRTNASWATRCRQRWPVPGTAPRDYTLRELDLGLDGHALAGIRFSGLDSARPFVGVLARTCPLGDRDAVARFASRLRDKFASFAPECFRLWKHGVDRGVTDTPGSRTEMFVMAGRLGELRARPSPHTSAVLELRPCRAADIYPAYCATFERFFAAQPSWRGRIHVESEQRLREAETEGVLRRAFVRGEPAGFFAAVPARERALAGFVILEEILDTSFRGRRLAPALQRMLLEHIEAAPDAIVFGHIDSDNLASLHTARAVGRDEVYRVAVVPLG